MPDMRDALQGAGFRGRPAQAIRPGGSQRGQTSGRDSGTNPFYQGYPKFFTDKDNLRVEMVLAEAQALANRFECENLKRSQLRAFYDHAKRQLQRLAYGVPFEEVHPEVARLKAFAADRAGRAENALPQSFKKFIDQNVEAVTDKISFQKGFMPHFEAVVAYCAHIKD